MTASAADPAVATRGAVADDWPHTSRPLPWVLAGFLALIWLVPFTGIDLKVQLPFDSTLDRVAIVGIVLAWMVFGRDPRRFGKRPMLFLGALGLYIALAFTSVIVNASRVIRLGTFDLSTKQLALLLAFGLFAWFAVNAMRPTELRAFSKLTVCLGALCAVGVIIERRTGFNIFYEFSRALLSPVANVAPSPTVINPNPQTLSRPAIVGPTEHGLAVSTMLAIALPFALVGLLDSRETRHRLAYAAVVGLIAGAAMATERKTSVVALVVVIVVLTVYRTRAMLRMWPLALVLAVAIHVAAPGALGTIGELDGFLNTGSSQGRTDDYAAITPDFVTRPVLGYGFGSLDISQVQNYRILDNEYLGELLQVGILGMAAYLALIAAVMALAHRAIRSRAPARASPALAASAGAAAYLVASVLFDAMSFPQAPYMFLFAGAVATVAATGLEPARAPQAAAATTPITAPTAR